MNRDRAIRGVEYFTSATIALRDRGPAVFLRHKSFSRLALNASKLWHLLTNLSAHRDILRLLKIPAFADTRRNNPKFAYKYLAKDYLVRGLTAAEHAACFSHHYGRLHDELPDRFLRQVLHWDIELYAVSAPDNRFAWSLGAAKPSDTEGELSLLLKVDGQIFFTLSFTIVPGRVVNSQAAEVLLISRLQGTAGCYPQETKLATKAMHGVRPRAALLSALEGIATALEIREIACVSAKRQITYCQEFDAPFNVAYDNFFTELGITKTATDFFLSGVPVGQKPLYLIKQSHKRTTKIRREFKMQIRLACAESFFKMTHRTVCSSETPPTMVSESVKATKSICS